MRRCVCCVYIFVCVRFFFTFLLNDVAAATVVVVVGGITQQYESFLCYTASLRFVSARSPLSTRAIH